MITITHNNLSLSVIRNFKKKDIGELKSGFSFDPAIADELSRPTLHPKIETYDGHIFMVLHFLHFKPHKHDFVPSEIDFIVSKNQIIIAQYENLKPLDDLIGNLSNNQNLKQKFFRHDSAYLLYSVIENLLRSLFSQLDHIKNEVDDIESDIFKGKEEEMVQLISLRRREALDFKRIIKPNIDVLKELSAAISRITEPGRAYFHINYLPELNTRVINLIENQAETLKILHETNETLLTEKTNRIMKLLTIFAVVVFPLTLLSSIWGMNVLNVPFSENPNGFWIMLGLMFFGAIVLLSIFKSKKWF